MSYEEVCFWAHVALSILCVLKTLFYLSCVEDKDKETHMVFKILRALLLGCCCVAFGGSAVLCLAAGLTLIPLKPHFRLMNLVALDAVCVLGGTGLNFVLVSWLTDDSDPVATARICPIGDFMPDFSCLDLNPWSDEGNKWLFHLLAMVVWYVVAACINAILRECCCQDLQRRYDEKHSYKRRGMKNP